MRVVIKVPIILKVIVHLLRSLDSMYAPAARAMVIWMMGEYSNIGSLISKMIPTLFTYLARCFTLEAVETKLQIINAFVKVVNNCGFRVSFVSWNVTVHLCGYHSMNVDACKLCLYIQEKLSFSFKIQVIACY